MKVRFIQPSVSLYFNTALEESYAEGWRIVQLNTIVGSGSGFYHTAILERDE